MHILSIVATLGMVFAATSAPKAGGFPTDVDWLLRARRTLPDLITDAPAHGVDLQRLLVQRHTVRDKLGRDLDRPRDYVTVEIDDVGLRPLVIYDARSGALARLSTAFRSIADALPSDPEPHRAAVFERVRATLDAPSLDLVRYALWSIDQLDPAARAGRLVDADLDGFRTQSALKKRLRLLEEAIGHRHYEHSLSPFHDLRSSLREGLFETQRTTQTHLRDHVILAEMNPDLAILKGLIGGDCSSRYCFGYPYAPLERVFAVLDRKREILGYTAITRTETGGVGTYFVNCINGRRIGAHRTLMILKGLSSLRDASVERLALPGFNGLGENINFPEIRNVVRRLVSSEKQVRQTFGDRLARWRIQSETVGHSHHFEAMFRNEVVRLLPPSALDDANFDVRLRDGSPLAELDTGALTSSEYFTAVLEAIGARQFQLARKLWFDLGGTASAIEALTTEVTNLRRFPEADWLARLVKVFAAYDFGDPEHFVETHPRIFEIGRLVAADAMRPSMRDETITSLLRLLGRQRDRTAAGFWPALDRFLRELAPDDREVLAQRARAARDRARKKTRRDLLYQIQSAEVYDDLIAILGCETTLTKEAAE